MVFDFMETGTSQRACCRRHCGLPVGGIFNFQKERYNTCYNVIKIFAISVISVIHNLQGALVV